MTTSDNLAIWNALYQSDPKHVKKITGKSYQGDSPKPHWIIFRLTEQFGPVGKGFGWKVLHSEYIDSIPRSDGVEKRHECRILFWWKDEDGKHEVESGGGTKSLYKAKVNSDGTGGYWLDDEDAEKKSITDAITKAASWLGVAGDIFMGQWNDSKYQAELRAGPKPDTPHDPETGEVRGNGHDHGEAIKQTWSDIVLDDAGLTMQSEPNKKALAYSAQMIKDIGTYKSQKGLNAYLAAMTKISAGIGKFPAIYRTVEAAITRQEAWIKGGCRENDPEYFGHGFEGMHPDGTIQG